MACSDNDDENGNGGNGEGGGNGGSSSAPSLPSMGIQHPVAYIDHGWEDNSIFNYSDGRLIGGYDTEYEADVTISYFPLEINLLSESDGGYTFKMHYSNVRTNDTGNITYAEIQVEESEDGWKDTNTGKVSIEYDGEGHMTCYSWDCSYSYGERQTISYTLTWMDGNMVRVSEKEVDMDEDGGEEYYSCVTTYTYGEDAPVNSGIFLFDNELDSEILFYAGLYGKTTKNIPTSVVEEVQSSSSSSFTNSYTYSVDKDEQGRIVALYKNGAEQERYGYDVQGAQVNVNPMAKKALRETGLKLSRLRRTLRR